MESQLLEAVRRLREVAQEEFLHLGEEIQRGATPLTIVRWTALERAIAFADEATGASPRERRDREAIRLLHQLRDLCEENSTMGAQINDWLVLIPHAETPPTEGPEETR